MEINSLTQKSIKSGIKNGWTADDFCEKYQCSEEEFEKKVTQLYKSSKRSANGKKVLAEIENNAKKHSGKKSSKKIAKDSKTVKAPESAPDNLDELKTKERALSNQLMSLESKFYELKNQHTQHQKELRQTKKSLETLRKSYVELATKYETISGQADAIAQSMNEISKEGKIKREELKAVRESIESLKTITLCVFNSGEITVESTSTQVIELDETGHDELYDSLAKNTLCDDLRQKDVKILARLLAINENITKDTDRYIEVICDNEELEKIFQQLI